MRTSWKWLIGVGLAAVALPVRADNPHVTAAMRAVPVEEAVATLSRASKIPLRVYTEADPAAAVPANPVRGTFNWRDTPFSTALREVCAKYALHPGRTMGGGYQLTPLFQAAPPPAGAVKKVGLVERGNLSIHIAATRVGINRMVRFDGAGDDVDDSHLAVEFVGRVKDGDADAIAGLRNVVATDDLGNKLAASMGDDERNVFSPSYPDEWAGHLLFQAPHPRARRLVSIRGDVLHYKVHKTLRFAVALPARGQTATHEAEDVLVKIVSFDPDPKPMPDAGEDGPPVGATLKVQLTSRSDEPVAPDEDPSSIAPILMDDQGNTHEPILFNANNQGPGGMLELECSYPRLKGKASKVHFCVVRKGQPEKLVSFEMRDIPLPAEKPFVAQRVPAPTPLPGAAGVSADHPFYQRDGGTLVQKVVLPAGTPLEGVLALGLSPQRAAGWGPIRWVNVPLEEGGIVRLPSLKPGKYRVRRTFRPAEGQTLPATGHWEGAEVEVQITPGKESTAPSLQWKSGATPRSGPSGGNASIRTPVRAKGPKSETAKRK